MQVGDINIVNSIIDLEVEVIAMQKALDYISKNNSEIFFKAPLREDIKRFRDEAFEDIKKRYPGNKITRS